MAIPKVENVLGGNETVYLDREVRTALWEFVTKEAQYDKRASRNRFIREFIVAGLKQKGFLRDYQL